LAFIISSLSNAVTGTRDMQQALQDPRRKPFRPHNIGETLKLRWSARCSSTTHDVKKIITTIWRSLHIINTLSRSVKT